jgi:hypothetical protein
MSNPLKITKLMTGHPQSVGETYTEHMAVAGSFSWHLFVAALACAVHAFLPFMFEKTGSQRVEMLYRRMVTHRDRRLAEPESLETQAA